MIQQKNQCIFLDRDGVLNVDRNTYTYKVEDFKIIPGVPEALALLKKKGFLLIVITNQAGIGKGLHSREAMHDCHNFLQDQVNHLIDAFYYSPYHPTVSASISRKPESLMLEKAIYRFQINPTESWMIGDKEIDIIPANELGIRTIRILPEKETTVATYTAKNLMESAQKILKQLII